MKRVFILLSCILMVSPLQAQLRPKGFGKLFRSSLTRQTLQENPKVVSAVLNRRVASSYKQAIQAEKAAHSRSFWATNRYLRPNLDVSFAPVLYPEAADFLTTNEQLSAYFITTNNRQIKSTFLPTLAAANEKKASFATSSAGLYLPQHPAKEDMHWLAWEVPQNTHYLLLGQQQHDFGHVQKWIGGLLASLRTRFPDKQIVLLTEFLPQNESFQPDKNYAGTKEGDYKPLWETAQQLNIPVIGLEPQFVQNLPSDLYLPNDYLANIWQSPEGMRLRNREWLNTIEHLHEQMPDALFIVHGGELHLDYTLPYSVGQKLREKSPTFFANLVEGAHINCYPEFMSHKVDRLKRKDWFAPYEENSTWYLPVTLFDYVTQGKFPQRVISVNARYSSLAGFDAQIKID